MLNDYIKHIVEIGDQIAVSFLTEAIVGLIKDVMVTVWKADMFNNTADSYNQHSLSFESLSVGNGIYFNTSYFCFALVFVSKEFTAIPS